MSLVDWVPALSTTALLAIVLYLSRAVIMMRLKNSVQHEFDRKLEMLRTDLHNSEESFRADLRSKENQIAALHSGAMSGLMSRQAALAKRRLQAVDQLWLALTSLAPQRATAETVALFKFEAAAEEAAKNPRLREMFKSIGAPFEQQKMTGNEAAKARPFVSPLAWAFFLPTKRSYGLQ
jgi:hypothetical protein